MNQLTTKLWRTLPKWKYSDDNKVSTSDNLNSASAIDPAETDPNSDTKDAFSVWERKLYDNDWSIPFTDEEILRQCLLSATKLALAGTADQDEYCKRFMEILLPDTFKMLLYSYCVDTWIDEVQLNIFNMIELSIDLIVIRLSSRPVPIQLLETLSMIFDCNSVFQRKHKNKSNRNSFHKELGDRALAAAPASSIFSVHNRNDTYGWLCQFINRFVLKDGVKNLRKQFLNEDKQPLTSLEYRSLLAPFVGCMNYLNKARYQKLFDKEIDQVLDYIENLNEGDFEANSINDTFELLSILRKIFSSVWSNRLECVNEMYLNLILKMITQSNSNIKMNSLKELVKIIEDSTLIPHNVVTEYIIKNSIIWKALEAQDIDQNKYMEKVRVLVTFIAPHFSKEDIEKIWKMQDDRSVVTILHLFTLIVTATAKFNLEQLNHLIGCIYTSWKTETMANQEKLVALLGIIGHECKNELSDRILEIVWIMAHEDQLSRSMLDRLLRCHYRVVIKDRPQYDKLKHNYCDKCINDLQQNNSWRVPAIKQLTQMLCHTPTNTVLSCSVDKSNLIDILIQSLSTSQQDVWNQTKGVVKIDTLVDGRFTYEESTQMYLDLLSFLVEKDKDYLHLKHGEKLWDILINNDRASSCDRELGFNWFIDRLESFDRKSQTVLFERRISDLDPLYLCPIGDACFKLYYTNYSQSFQPMSKLSASSINPIIKRDLNSLICIRQGDLTAEKSDVIVVCSSSMTLCESIFKIGGKPMKNLYEIEFQKNPTAPIITVAANDRLATKAVYFLPWQPDADEIKFCNSLNKFVSDAMEKAASENYQSIAFPAIGCGQYKCPINRVAQTIVQGVHRQLLKSPMSVVFVIQPDRMDVYNEFQKQITLIQQTPEIKPIATTIGKATIEVEMGDITTQKVDIIVGSSSSHMLKREIMAAVSGEVQMEYAKEHKNNPDSLIISFPPGRLPCKRIFFAKWEPSTDEKDLERSIVDLIWIVIQHVILSKFTSIAFPAIGCGKHDCSKEIVIKTMVREVKHQIQMRNLSLTVKFIVQPQHVDIYDEFCKQVLSSKEDVVATVSPVLPSTWIISTENIVRFVLPIDTDEYKSVVNNFNQAMKGTCKQIIKIERIQNKRWYIQYRAHCQDFKERLKIDTERRLYHGCPQSAADLIIQDCFNRSFAGVNGTVYGFGVYFSSNVAYSHSYATPNSKGERFMFVSRVLVGKSILGNSSMKTRPVGFDSTTDGDHIIVTYHDAQALAEHLITYK